MKHFALALIVFFGWAMGQGLSSEMQRCSAIEGDTERLACFDALAQSLEPDDDNTSEMVGNWLLDEQANPINDSITTIYFNEATEGTNQFGQPIYLTFRCQDDRIDAFIIWGGYVGYETKEVSYRIGTAEGRADTWYTSSNGQVTFYSQNESVNRQFMQELAASDNGSFVAQVTPDVGNRMTAVFDLAGIEDVNARLFELCPN